MSKIETLTSSDGHHLSAYIAGDADAERAIVVIQEAFGVTPYIRSVCDRLAKMGYHAISPALYDRVERDLVLAYEGDGLKRALETYASCDQADALLDVSAAADYLHQAGHKRVGAIGFCWGGLLSWRMATQTQKLQAAVSWYGGGIAAESHAAPHCPVQLHFGGQDAHIPHTDILTIRQNQPDLELFVYDQADHGFGCFDRSSYNEDAASLAWQRSMDFLSQHI
ncbi:MAG: dienelactone hydrolase family protein [Acetobacteraceae bacterium]